MEIYRIVQNLKNDASTSKKFVNLNIPILSSLVSIINRSITFIYILVSRCNLKLSNFHYTLHCVYKLACAYTIPREWCIQRNIYPKIRQRFSSESGGRERGGVLPSPRKRRFLGKRAVRWDKQKKGEWGRKIKSAVL